MQASLTPMKNKKTQKETRQDKKRQKLGYNRQELREAKRQH
jgi:hypothetical protein